MIEVHQLPALSDNYIYVIRDPVSGRVGVVDPGEAEPVDRFLGERGWRLDDILITHHHPDHVGGIRSLVSRHGCRVHGSAADAARIPGIGLRHAGGDEFDFGAERVRVFAADGHTLGHIVYWFAGSGALFVGDTIFSLGCGRLFEGTPEQMWASIERLRELPAETLVYNAHEYTLDNAAFARLVEPENERLHARIAEVERLRAAGRPTVPTTLESERACNPFLRPESAEIRKNVGSFGDKLWMVFGATRAAKDRFDRGGTILPG